MTTAIQRRRGTTAQHSTFTGLNGELTVDTDKKTVVVHDGVTAGGIPLAKETGSAISATSLTDSGNLTFTGTGNRITGDFSNGTFSSRVSFQSSTTNGVTGVQFLPNGTSTTATVDCYNAADPTNAAFGQIQANATEVRLTSNIRGTGTYLPMTFYTGGSERVRIDTSGNVGVGTSTNLSAWSAATLQVNTRTSLSQLSNDLHLSNNAYYDGAWKYQASAAATNYYHSGGIHVWRYAGAGTAGNAITWSEAMRIDSSGNVGIGVTPTSGYGVLQFSGNGSFLSKADGTSSFASYNSETYLISNATLSTGGVWTARATTASSVSTRNGEIVFSTNSGLTSGNSFSPTERLRIDSSGNVLVKSPAGLGYGTGAGGTVTQATSKSTAVTLNTPTGQITMNNASLAAGATVGFTVTNSTVAATDTVVLNITNTFISGYRIRAGVGAGSFTVYLTNETGSPLSDAVVFNFAIIKGSAS